MGYGVHFGALSKIDEIAIRYYGHLPVLLHDIDPNVDASRDLFEMQVATSFNYDVLGVKQLVPAEGDNVVAGYETDGGVLIIAETAVNLPEEIYCCPIDRRNP